jgi:Cu2+-containing amine oxidase
MVEEPGYAKQFARENKAVVDELLHNIVPEVIGKRISAGEEIEKKYVIVDRPKGISFIKLISRGTEAEKEKISEIHKEIAEKAIALYSPVVEANRHVATGKAVILKEKTALIEKEIDSLERQEKLLKQKGNSTDTLAQIAIERVAEKIADKKIKLADARLALNDALYSVESFVDTHYTPIARSIDSVSPNTPLLIVFGAITGFLLAVHLIAFKVIRERL